MPEQTLLDVPAHGALWVWAFAVECENRSGPNEAIYIGKRNGCWLSQQLPPAVHSGLLFDPPRFAESRQYSPNHDRVRVYAARDELGSQCLRMLGSQQAQDVNRDCKSAVNHVLNM